MFCEKNGEVRILWRKIQVVTKEEDKGNHQKPEKIHIQVRTYDVAMVTYLTILPAPPEVNTA